MTDLQCAVGQAGSDRCPGTVKHVFAVKEIFSSVFVAPESPSGAGVIFICDEHSSAPVSAWDEVTKTLVAAQDEDQEAERQLEMETEREQREYEEIEAMEMERLSHEHEAD